MAAIRSEIKLWLASMRSINNLTSSWKDTTGFLSDGDMVGECEVFGLLNDAQSGLLRAIHIG